MKRFIIAAILVLAACGKESSIQAPPPPIIAYYRIVEVDQDGDSTYTIIKSIQEPK